MKNSADLGGFHPPQPSALLDSTLLGLQNSSYPAQPHSIIAKYQIVALHTKKKINLMISLIIHFQPVQRNESLV